MSSSQLARNVRYALRWMPDRAFIQLNYFARFHRFANLSNPTTYNEKLNWLKLHDRNPVYPTLVDKAAAKDYVRKILGPEYVIPTLGIWERFEEIPFDELPERFVLKCTHDSEGVVLVPDKAAMDRAVAEKKIREALGRNFYYIGREWPYREVQPRIIAEPFLEDRETGELRDYKFFCFGGEPKVMFISSGRSGEGMTCDFYDMDFQHLDLRRKYPNASKPIARPKNFEEMKECARKLTAGFPHLRADLYEVNGRVYFGELTLYTSSGFVPFHPEKWDRIFGDMITLPQPGGADA